ncbi:multidrug resistance protein [Actinobacillus equuli]|nr:multidrug resistance protein [Actinobacillus equuli]
MIPMSFSIATTIVVGKTLGQKQVEQAKIISYHALITGAFFALAAAIMIVILDEIIPLAFTSDPISIGIAAHLLLFAAVYQIPDSLQAVANGILRGYKHTKPILYVTMFCYWVIGMPFGYIWREQIGLLNRWQHQAFGLFFASV